MVPGTVPPAPMTNVSFELGAPVTFVNPVNASDPMVPAPVPLRVQVESVAGPMSVAFAPVALSCATFLKETVAGPLMAPAVPDRVHVASAPLTSSEPVPAPS